MKRGSSQSTTVTRVGHYTKGPYLSGARTESYRKPPMTTAKQPGGKSARVVKSPPRGCGSY